jgi:hypothetical protein
MSLQKIPDTDYFNLKQQPLAGSTFNNLLRVFFENKFTIDLPFLPRALYVSLMSLSLAPLRFYEKYKFHKKIEEFKPSNPLFIIGHWRSGTTFLHYLMGQDKSFSYVSTLETMTPHHFLAFESFVKKIIEQDLPEKRPMDNLEMETSLPYEEEYAVANLCPYSFYHGWYFPKNLFSYFTKYVLFSGVKKEIIEQWKHNYLFLIKKISYKYNSQRILLKSLVNTARIKLLLEIFPEAQFIHLSRHPLKVYLSTLKLYQKILPIFSFQKIDIRQLDYFILKIYKDLYAQYFKEKHLIPKENLIELQYETFVHDPLGTLQKIYSDFNLTGYQKTHPLFLKYLEKHQNYKPDAYTYDDELKEKIYKHWYFTFKKFGYDPYNIPK